VRHHARDLRQRRLIVPRVGWTYAVEHDNGETPWTYEVELSVEFDFIPAGGDGWNEPRYPASAEFVKAEMLIGNTWQRAPRFLQAAAAQWLEDEGQDEAIAASIPDPDYALERLRDERLCDD
jgi:hypothetical protein